MGFDVFLLVAQGAAPPDRRKPPWNWRVRVAQTVWLRPMSESLPHACSSIDSRHSYVCT